MNLTEMLTRSLEKETSKVREFQTLRQIRSYRFTPTNNHITDVVLPDGMTCTIIGHWFYPVVAITKVSQPIGFDSVADAMARLGKHVKYIATV